MALHLVIGNKNYSSWSLRPWLALKVAGIPFTETVIPLYEPGSAETIRRHSPAGKVPVLIDGDVVIWESLAILEYLAELSPGLWPGERAARAHARAVANEMHAGFAPLRRHLPMCLWRVPTPRPLDGEAAREVAANVARIADIWAECRQRFGEGGPFLYGRFTAADAMYAPVVARLFNYAVAVDQPAAAYMQAVMDLPAFQEWTAAALRETWVMPGSELDGAPRRSAV